LPGKNITTGSQQKNNNYDPASSRLGKRTGRHWLAGTSWMLDAGHSGTRGDKIRNSPSQFFAHPYQYSSNFPAG
jgi:hypothetical protein